ncbi:MAG TPA: thioredoxin domain-containing protein [Gemmataceae bacterium]|nr:thioredoxin domain-containing protein [Gemmataceae bacterium]
MNRLIHETSPYLRQHANNPVDWYPWGPEALARARELDRPIFLSIGYSACHWCHVMERESFEDPETARLLNEHFVSIKVDREERPDLDQIYMTAVQLLTGQGGWPMSMFLTPDLRPFYGGTYFPPRDAYGRPSFKRLLQALADAWQKQREQINAQAGQVTEHVQKLGELIPVAGGLDESLIRHAVPALREAFDPVHGGFGSAPKFPHPLENGLLLRAWRRFGDDDALAMVRRTLDHMAMGGIYDHLGGGFHRYSTDERWLVPHFEKMLYDNALLAVSYLDAFQATGEPLYREIVQETLAYVRREMTSPEGPFYSTQDADSEGVEGKFFVWSAAEIDRLLGQAHAEVFREVYGVTPEGNWEGHNILNRARTFEQTARLLRMPEVELRRLLDEARQKLFEARGQRVPPGRDDKVLTAWNGLMIDAFARAAAVLAVPEYADIATRAADFVLSRMRSGDGRLLRTWKASSEPKLNAYLEDYAFLIGALVSLYEATFKPRWIVTAQQLADVMIDQFWDSAEGGFFYTGRDHEALIARTKDPHDSSIPSGNSAATMALLRLGKLAGKAEYLEKAEATLRLFRGLMEGRPSGVAGMLAALDFYLGPVQEFAVVGDPAAADTRQVLALVFGAYRPNKVVALRAPGPEAEPILPLLHDKKATGAVTTYICQNFTCQAPLVGVEALEAALATC